MLRTFLRGGKLVSIPTQHAKKLVVLDRLAQEFDIGVRYSERQVNALLRRFHDDAAALRRYLVDEGFLDRARRRVLAHGRHRRVTDPLDPASPWRRPVLASGSTAAVVAGGAELVEPADADALVWAVPDDPAELAKVLDQHPHIRVGAAAVGRYRALRRGHPGPRRTDAGPAPRACTPSRWPRWRSRCCSPVRAGLGTYARAATWSGPQGRNLLGARVVVAGGGGITESFLRLVAPFGCETTVVRRRPEPMAGAARVVGMDGLDAALDGADALVLALALTPETEGMIDRRRLDLLADGAWVVNVARGRHIVTDDLVDALRAGTLGGAGLDVTEPEPLPDGHPLWAMPNVLITPHVGNTPEMAVPLLSARITENVRRWQAGEPLLGPVDPALGY